MESRRSGFSGSNYAGFRQIEYALRLGKETFQRCGLRFDESHARIARSIVDQAKRRSEAGAVPNSLIEKPETT